MKILVKMKMMVKMNMMVKKMKMMMTYPCHVPQASPSPQTKGRNIHAYTFGSIGDSGLEYVPGLCWKSLTVDTGSGKPKMKGIQKTMDFPLSFDCLLMQGLIFGGSSFYYFKTPDSELTKMYFSRGLHPPKTTVKHLKRCYPQQERIHFQIIILDRACRSSRMYQQIFLKHVASLK